jgi:hypothetical protein
MAPAATAATRRRSSSRSPNSSTASRNWVQRHETPGRSCASCVRAMAMIVIIDYLIVFIVAIGADAAARVHHTHESVVPTVAGDTDGKGSLR